MSNTTPPPGERIAKVLARAGVASRREVERMIALGQVAVNGKVIDSPALNVTGRDRITVDGKPVAEAEPARLWLYYKPLGLVTSASDEKGRETVFDTLPEDMPRVMSVGRLDLNSEGLLLLTNDGAIKRRLELPSTGWLRKYRVRVNGTPDDVLLEPLRKGITVEGERFQPMEVTLDRQQGANAWLTVGLREGRNREIRRAMNAVGLVVNRLIRVSYGPFRLGEMQPGEVQEVKAKVLRDQLGLEKPAEADQTGRAKPAGRPVAKAGARPGPKPGARMVEKAAERSASAPGAKAGAKPGPRSGVKPGPKPDAKPGAKPAAKPAAKTWPKAGAKPAVAGLPRDAAGGPGKGRPARRKPAGRD